MTEQRTIAFSKMSGLGNDFIIIDARENALALTPAQVRQLATRDNEITKGCDQVLVLHPPKSGGDIFMQIFNADGGEVEACGNGTRAVTQWLAAKGGIGQTTIETLGGILRCEVVGSSATVAMPAPKFGWRDIPLSEEIADTSKVKLHEDLPPAFLVNVGNPHAVFFVEGEQNVDAMAAQYGEELVHHSLFAQGANINFASTIENVGDEIDIATWERGAGLTQACGTGACAATIAAYHRGLLDNALPPVLVYPPFSRNGGSSIFNDDSIEIDYDLKNGELLKTAPITFKSDGEITL